MDISTTTQPKSDQQNFDDYAGGPKTLTITEVRAGTTEQPIEIHLAEFPGRPYKPSKSMRRVLLAAWGAETDNYAGRRIRLAGDPTIKFGGAAVGGIKIDALSHIAKPLSIALTVTKGKRTPFTVQPLKDTPAPPDDRVTKALHAIRGARTTDELTELWALVEQRGLQDVGELVEAHGKRAGELGES